MLKLFLLGRPYIEIEDTEIRLSRRKNLALLAYLALAEEPRRREELIALLWPELDTYHAQTALRRDLWVLHQALAGVSLLATPDVVGLPASNEYWCDVTCFQELLAAHRTEPSPEAPSPEVPNGAGHTEQLISAIQLYRDDFLRGFSLRDSPAFDEWQLAQTEALRHQLTIALNTLIGIYTHQQQWDLAITYAQRLLELDPLHELAHYQLMVLYTNAGRDSAALQQYGRCTNLLSENLGIAPSARTTDLQAEIQARLHQDVQLTTATPTERMIRLGDEPIHRTQPVPLVTSSSITLTNLPTPATPFVGRSAEVAQLTQILKTADCRLLTMLGFGGIGKTRLAIEVAHRLCSHYADGVYFVRLAPLRHPELLAAALLEALGVMRESDRSPEETLLSYLRSRHLLLVLDNFEHLHAGVAFLQRLLANTEVLQLLVTSRERLNIPEEWVHPLVGLTYPAAATGVELPTAVLWDDAPAQDALGQDDAIQLFHACARRIQPTMPLSVADETSVIKICQLVEGNPLAIELAAAWLPIMSCAVIAQALQSGLDLLATTQEGIVDRHRSMRATLDYSWRLATPAEQIVLAKLASFHGGFLPALAQAVADADPVMMRTLADKSWLHRGRGDRIEMHELVRQFCAEKLADGALDPQVVLTRHAHAYGNFMQQWAVALRDHRQVAAVQAIVGEADNVRAAWRQALAVRDVDLLDDLLESFYHVGLIRNWHVDMVTLFTETLDALSVDTQAITESNTPTYLPSRQWVIIRLHVRLARYLADMGHFDQAMPHCAASLALLSAAVPSDPTAQQWRHEEGFALAVQSEILFNLGDHDAAAAQAEQARTLLSTTGLDEAAVLAIRIAAQCHATMGEQQAAIALLADVAAQLRHHGELWLRSRILVEVVFYLRTKSETALAQHYTEERLALCQTLDDQRGIAQCLEDFGYNVLFTETPDPQAAEPYLAEMLAMSDALRHPLLRADALFGLGQIAYFNGKWAAARRDLEESYAILYAEKAEGRMLLDLLWLGEVALAEGKYDEAERRFAKVLKQAVDNANVTVTLLGLEGLAKTGLRQGEILHALPILLFIQQHLNTWEFARSRINLLLQELQEELPRELFAAAVTRGAAMALSEAISWAGLR